MPKQKQPKDKFDVQVFKTFSDAIKNKEPKELWKYKADRGLSGFPKNPEREDILKGVMAWDKELPTPPLVKITAKAEEDKKVAAFKVVKSTNWYRDKIKKEL